MARSRLAWLVGLGVVLAGVVSAQERPVPKDSERISIPGCARGRAFVVHEPADYERVTEVRAGTRFRMQGQKALLSEIEAREGSMIEVTGLVRKSLVRGPGGIAIAGGRIRLGGAVPRAPLGEPGRDPGYDQVVTIDVESWRPLPDRCPGR